MKIRWTPEAANDLEQIARHLLRDNPKAARTVVRTISDSIANLKKFPKVGRPGVLENTRELIISRLPYIVVYRLKDDNAEILRVYHAAQDWP